MSNQLLSNATKGLVLSLAEILKATGQAFPLTAGPFHVDVQDPNGTIAVVPGTDDQKTPTIFRPNGSGKTGTVTVTVTDNSPTLKAPLTGSSTFDVVAPAPPPPPAAPDTLVVAFTPEL
jgi:hypothetical protein